MSALALTVALPLLAAFLLRLVWRVSPLAGRALGPLVLVFSLYVFWQQWLTYSQPYELALGGFAPPFGIAFHIDRLALLFGTAVPLVTLLLWPYTSTSDDGRESALLLLLVASSTGMALSGDLFNIYVFYELAAVASYGLVAARRTAAGFAAAFRFLLVSALGSVVALLGIGLIYFQTGTLNLAHLGELHDSLIGPVGFVAFGFLVIGFGVKAELFPVNGWVPEAYRAASRRTAGLLAGLVSKLAVLVIVRAVLLIYPGEEARHLLLALGIVTVLTGELAAWRARDLAGMLSWSSIGQLGIVFIAFSIPGNAGVVAGLAVALHHLVVKPGLFLLAEQWGNSIDRLQGGAKVSPLAAALLAVFALSLAGVPPFPGFWAKLLVITGLASTEAALYFLGLGVMLAMTVVEANYLFRLVVKVYTPAGRAGPPAPHGRLDLGISALFGIVLLLGIFSANGLHENLKDTARDAAHDDYSAQRATLPHQEAA